jgi:phenylalanyl-tRNA synthetase beta chain
VRFSLDWLRQHVEIDLEPEELARKLTSVGFAVEGIEPLDEDVALEVEVTGNRPDCMNHRGLAREIAAITGRPLRPLETGCPESSRPTSEAARVEIEDAELCSRYTARVILGVRLGPSPAWLERRLRAIGLMPKWNVVDAANYVLWDLGHPLHTFDLANLSESRIVVRRARPGEKLLTVADEIEHALDPSMLLIADSARPVAVAGVMGGLESGITGATRDVLIESAWFDPVSVRRTARALGMHTDASHRFERGADPEMTLQAADRLCRMILDVSGGECLSGAIDVVARKQPRRELTLRRGRLVSLLGADVPDEKVLRILTGLEIPLEETRNGWTVSAPSHRSDLLGEEDLIEEVARSIGYDALPSTLPVETPLPPERQHRDERDQVLRETLARAGYCEVIGYAMVGREEDESFGRDGAPPPLRITNPLSERWEVMRRSIFPGLVRSAGHNLRHGQRDFALFEVGTIFHRPPAGKGVRHTPGPKKPHPEREDRCDARPSEPELPLEESVVGLLVCGRAGATRWNLPRHEYDLYDLTGSVEAIARVYRAGPVTILPASYGFLHPHQSFSATIGGKEIALGGIIHPELIERLELAPKCAVAQVSLTTLRSCLGGPATFRALPRYPAVSRDISAIVLEEVPYADVERVVAEAVAGTPSRFALTDRYDGPPLPRGRVSLTFNISIEPEDRTWTLEEIDALTGRVMQALERQIGAEIRR